MNASQSYTFLLALLFALGAGLVGCFALMKKMLLASDVISHLALPGLGIAFLLKFNPLAGGAATLFLGTLLVWRLQKRTGLAADAAIGVIFAAALAIGAAVTPREDLVEALFGNFEQLSLPGFLLGLAGVLFVILRSFAQQELSAVNQCPHGMDQLASRPVKADLGVRLFYLEGISLQRADQTKLEMRNVRTLIRTRY